MLRLSKLTDYAVVVLVRLGGEARFETNLGVAVQTSPGISAVTGIPEPTVAKVLKCLAAASLVVSTRGARGGYRIAKPLDSISIVDVIAAIDGPIALTACVDGSHAPCDVRGQCAMRGRWDVVNDAIQHALNAITLADMCDPSTPRALMREPALAASAE